MSVKYKTKKYPRHKFHKKKKHYYYNLIERLERHVKLIKESGFDNVPMGVITNIRFRHGDEPWDDEME